MSIGLMMIVKDEAHVIERCLASVKPYVDWWVIADTGSSDGTQEVVRGAMADVPGELVEREWVSFGHNRQEVLELARASEHRTPDDYVLWIDADEQLRDLPSTRAGLDRDGYFLTTHYAGSHYGRLALVRLDRPWTWKGPIHEYLDLPGATMGDLAQPTVHVEHDGARSRDPDTYRKDAALIVAALEAQPDDPRLQFYLAQSLRDAGETESALAAYRVRVANQDGWAQERWNSLHWIAVLRERLAHPVAEVAQAYLDAHQACPWRAESLVELARFERQCGRFAVGLLYARAAAALPMPGHEGLFVDTGSYTWRAWDEVAINAYWTGAYAEGADAARRALAVRPDDERLQANLAYCESQLS